MRLFCVFACFLYFVSATGFKIVNEPVLTNEMVDSILRNATEEAKKNGWNVSVTVVDRSGVVLGVIRDYRAGVHTVRASFKKAFTAVSQKRTTKEIAEGMNTGKVPGDLKYLHEDFTTLDGGIPIVVKGVVVGGIGVGGAHGSQDIQVAEAGLKAIEGLK